MDTKGNISVYSVHKSQIGPNINLLSIYCNLLIYCGRCLDDMIHTHADRLPKLAQNCSFKYFRRTHVIYKQKHQTCV